MDEPTNEGFDASADENEEILDEDIDDTDDEEILDDEDDDLDDDDL